jgi:2-amino-4-hydroxy-6-hydroxymethyldihydropteridine diphosphokinase
MSCVYLSLGSSLGDRDENIERALNLLLKKIRIVKRSSFYETESAGCNDQPCLLNIAVEADTLMAPFELLTFTKSIEKKMKRVKTIFNGPRDMDIDILLYDDEIIHTPELVIPHPRMLDRAFVLAPLSEIAPDLIVLGRSIKHTLEIFDDVQVRKRG